MSDKNNIIKVSHLSKEYYIGQYSGGTFQHELQSWWAKKRGREDPNRKIFAQEPKIIKALDDVSFDVFEGDSLGIIGRNGSGKSTLLKILCEITAPTEGDIDICGRISSMLEVGTGFDKEMTGRENIYLNGTILGMSREEIDAKIDEIIEFSELEQFIDTPVKRYSSGMYTKLAFSVAAHLDNDIMIMDEVLAVGDIGFRQKCVEKIRAKGADGRTILYVGHTMNYLRQVCERCMVLDKGKLLFIGDTDDAVQYYMEHVEKETEKRKRETDDRNRAKGIVRKDESAASVPAKPLFLGPDRNVSDTPRSRLLTQHKMHLNRVFYVGKDNILFSSSEKATITFCWTVLEDYKDLCLRLEVYTDQDRHLASYPFYDIGEGVTGEEKSFTVTVDISMFVPGTYKFKQSFFFRNEEGVVNTDRVIGLSFKKERAAGEEFWLPSSMSNIRIYGQHED